MGNCLEPMLEDTVHTPNPETIINADSWEEVWDVISHEEFIQTMGRKMD